MLRRWYWTKIMRLSGWRVEHAGPLQSLSKSMIAVAPHTSWRDFFVGLMTRNVIGVNVRFIAKHTLFKFPLGIILKALGGTPVNRSRKSNLVDQVVEIYNNHSTYHISITPEGTRERVTRFRSGFYHMAKLAKVPLILSRFDYANKVVEFSDPIPITDDQEADFEKIYAFFDGVAGYHPEQSFYLNTDDVRSKSD